MLLERRQKVRRVEEKEISMVDFGWKSTYLGSRRCQIADEEGSIQHEISLFIWISDDTFLIKVGLNNPHCFKFINNSSS